LPYDSKRIDRRVKLRQIDEWKLQSHFGGHPFHIHVNPFQIVEIKDPFDRDVSGEDAIDWASGINPGKIDPNTFDPNTFDPSKNPDVANIDLEYRGLKGVWRDTIWVKAPLTQPVMDALMAVKDESKRPKSRFYTIVVRTHYQRFPGDFVMHCHILDHEDQGMMQNVSIELP
jgi:FtsP/CotA-like multicopper oxidase with cupredoxin domain